MIKRKGNELKDTLGEIKYSGEFDYEAIYMGIYNWLSSKKYDIVETYKHKMTGAGAEVELSFEGGRKISEFLKYNIKAEVKTWNMVDIEVVRNGKKQKINKGRLIITISFNMVMDYNAKFDKSEWDRRLFNFVRLTLWKKKIMILWAGNLVGECYQLHTKIKEILGMETAYSAW